MIAVSEKKNVPMRRVRRYLSPCQRGRTASCAGKQFPGGLAKVYPASAAHNSLPKISPIRKILPERPATTAAEAGKRAL